MKVKCNICGKIVPLEYHDGGYRAGIETKKEMKKHEETHKEKVRWTRVIEEESLLDRL